MKYIKPRKPVDYAKRTRIAFLPAGITFLTAVGILIKLAARRFNSQW